MVVKIETREGKFKRQKAKGKSENERRKTNRRENVEMGNVEMWKGLSFFAKLNIFLKNV